MLCMVRSVCATLSSDRATRPWSSSAGPAFGQITRSSYNRSIVVDLGTNTGACASACHAWLPHSDSEPGSRGSSEYHLGHGWHAGVDRLLLQRHASINQPRGCDVDDVPRAVRLTRARKPWRCLPMGGCASTVHNARRRPVQPRPATTPCVNVTRVPHTRVLLAPADAG